MAGQFFLGPWRTTIATGNIGTLPLTSPTIFNSISYAEIGELYGFIAIGYFKPPTTGTYTFFTSSDDYSGVWLGDIAAATSGRTSANAVVNNGMDLGAPGQPNTKRSGTIALVAGVSYPIRIVHEEGGGGDNLTFSWSGPGIAETTNLSQYFTVTTEKIGERVSVSSAATESLSFTTSLRERIAAESNATFDLTQVSSDGELFVSNNLIAKAAGAARLRFESIINNLEINSTPSLRERINFTTRLPERANISSLTLELLDFTTSLRERINTESTATFDLTQVSSDGELFVSNNLIAKAAGKIHLSLDSSINNLEINSTPSLRERLNFTTRLVERANLSSLNLEFINFTTGIRDRAVSNSSALFTFADVFSERPLFDSSILIAKTAGKAGLSIESTINNIEIISTPSLREILNFTTRVAEIANPSSLTLELVGFTTRLRERISAQSVAIFDLAQVSSDRELFVSNTLSAKTRGTLQLSIESTINNVEVKSTPSLRERLNFTTNLHEKKQADSEGLEQINFTTQLRDRISAESSAKFSILDTSSEGQLFVSNALSAKARGTIQLSIESTINNIEITSTPSLRERLNFTTRVDDKIVSSSLTLDRLNFTTILRERISSESDGNIDLTQVSSEGALFISNRLAVKSVANESIDFTRDIASTIDAKSSLRSRISVPHALGPERINADSGGRIRNIGAPTQPNLGSFRERVSAISDGSIIILDTSFGPFIGWGIPL